MVEQESEIEINLSIESLVNIVQDIPGAVVNGMNKYFIFRYQRKQYPFFFSFNLNKCGK